MSGQIKSELVRYVEGSLNERVDIKVLVKEFFVSERCSEIIKLVLAFIERFPELSHDRARIEILSDFSNDFEESKKSLVELMDYEVISLDGKPFKEIVAEGFVRQFKKIDTIKKKLCFEKDAMLFMEGCKMFGLEEKIHNMDFSSVDSREVFDLGVLYGTSGGAFEFLEKFMTGNRLEFYLKARQSAVMVERHGKNELYEDAIALAKELWTKGSLLNHSEMAEHIVQTYSEYANLSRLSLRDRLKEVGREFSLTKGCPGYKGK